MEKFIKSFGYAITGITAAWKSQSNLKIQTAIAVLVIIAGLYFGITRMEWMMVLIVIGIVMSLELVNTALEETVNLITKERHPLAGKIKDISAGAVLLFSVVAAIVGILIFGKYIVSI